MHLSLLELGGMIGLYWGSATPSPDSARVRLSPTLYRIKNKKGKILTDPLPNKK